MPKKKEVREEEPKSIAIKPCECSHEFQDTKYGAGKRLHNQTKTGWRCTVCGKNRT